MDDDTVLHKSQRLFRICHLLYRHPKGLTTRELARLCHVGQRTIQRDLDDLEDMRVPIWEGHERPTRYGIEKGYYLPPIHLELPEAVALYLAARLLARYSDRCDAHTPSALAKLAGVLPDPLARYMHATIERLATRLEAPVEEEVMETLATGWAAQRVVHIRYLGINSEEPREYDVRPYCLEASGEGNAVYIIGWAVPPCALRTFKVERILQAQLMPDTFELPEDFDGMRLLDSCWGIMYGDEAEEVILRFAPSATRRLKETIWHPSQRLSDLADGGCELRFILANPEEMVYWIRGWGPQVEVLAPTRLREQMAEEARRLAEVYGDGAV